MKNFSKHFLTKNNLLIVVIFLIAAGVRFYNFPNRVTFWSEQARSLIVSANYIKEKPSLLGQEYFRQDSNAHTIYSGALFNYSLVPLLLVFNYDPVIITIFFALLNLFTGLTIYLVVKKLFGEKLALFSTLLFLFNDFMIYHSLFIWNYNYLPLIGILVLYFSWKYMQGRKIVDLLLTGLLCGIGVSLQFLFVPITLAVLIVNMWKSKKLAFGILIFGFGMTLGNFPMLLFDIRHNFYEIRTLLQYLLDTLTGKSDATFAYYYFLPFWSIFALIGGVLLFWLWKRSKVLTVFIVAMYLFLNLNSKIINLESPTGMPEGLKVMDIDKASKIIANDANSDFNVAEVLDFDKQAYVLRYFLQFKNNKTPQGVADYPNAKVLYVLSEKDYNFVTSDVWEIKSAGLTQIHKLADVGSGCAIYKLEK